MFKVTDDNYSYYKQVFEIFWKYYAELSKLDSNAEFSPVKVIEAWEKESKLKAKKGLKEGLREMLTMCRDFSVDMKKPLNEQLISKGLPGFEQLVSAINNTPQKVLKRGKIKNLDEYYVIKEFLDDLTSGISETDRERLGKIFSDFENNYNKKSA